MKAADPIQDFGGCWENTSLPRWKTPFAILDASQGQDEAGWNRILHELHEEIVCRAPEEIPACFRRIQACLAQGCHVLALFNYELAYGLHSRLAALLPPAHTLFRALAFKRREQLTHAEIDACLAKLAPDTDSPSGVADVRRGVTYQDYLRAVERIQRYICAGDCYQANYTFQVGFDYFGSPLQLYRRLRERQHVGFGAFIALENEYVLSFSPELFVRRVANRLTVKPMKGTMRRGIDRAEDAFLRESLPRDEKNRAEHIMIVDLLRNDLGRLARIGSVRVDRLFEVETYRTLLQMTSTISAEVASSVSLQETFEALFPCGSVTGAPKLRCMEIIGETEKTPRGLYCGAIGFIEPAGDFCFNVPIRTLVLDGHGHGSFGIGGGIVHDSRAPDEYAECLLKGSFVTGVDPGFQLIESLLCDEREYANLESHLRRLGASANYFGFAYDESSTRARLEEHRAAMADRAPRKTRLLLAKDGAIELESGAPLVEQCSSRVLVSPHRTNSADVLLRHKTTARKLYDQALSMAVETGCFDVLFFNERGELTEGTRTNVFLQLDGAWYTPPLSCGLLPGIMRQRLLADPVCAAAQRVLYAHDLARAERIWLTNAVRGVVEVSIRPDCP